MDFRVTFYDTTKYENICTIFKLYKPPVAVVTATYTRAIGVLIGGKRESLFMVGGVALRL
jgi:hypothetical protein